MDQWIERMDRMNARVDRINGPTNGRVDQMKGPMNGRVDQMGVPYFEGGRRATEALVDREVVQLLRDSHARVTRLLTKHSADLHKLSSRRRRPLPTRTPHPAR